MDAQINNITREKVISTIANVQVSVDDVLIDGHSLQDTLKKSHKALFSKGRFQHFFLLYLGETLKDIYHSYLFTNIVRANRPYTYNPDINGNFVITALDADDADIEADYTVIHFSLQHPELLDNKSIHLYGNFNNYTIGESSKMIYNPKSGYFEISLTLKQGFYNYKHVIVDKHGNMDEGAISGNFDLTENNYKVLVYYRDLGARYDKIIGFGEGTSINIRN